MKKNLCLIVIAFIIGIWGWKFYSDKKVIRDQNTHKALITFNSCENVDDCYLIRGTIETQCIYLINRKNIDRAIVILKSTNSKMQNNCSELDHSSGVICSEAKKCTWGEGPIPKIINW